MKLSRSIPGALLLSLLSTAACVHQNGTKVTDQDLARLTVSQSTKADAVRVLGEPQASMDSVNEGNFYDKECGERGDKLEALTFTFSQQKEGFTTNEVKLEMASLLFRKSDGKFCGISRVSNSAKGHI